MKLLLVSEGKHEQSGALEVLVQRTVPKKLSCTSRNVRDSAIRLHRGKGHRLFKRLVGWMQQARKENFDALVLLVDEDGDRERIRDVGEAQLEQQLTAGIPRALGVAVRSFDAWILADEKAISDVLEYVVRCQPSPEYNTDPKGSCAEILAKSPLEIWQRDFYTKVAERIDLECLSKRCPEGFGTFAARLRSL